MATGNMRSKFILNMGGRVDHVVLLDSRFMGELGMVLSSASKGEAFGVNLTPSVEES